MRLRVQGQPELTRDGKDIQLKPYHIMKVPHEGRKDTAPEKRVELHLHTENVQHGRSDGHGRRQLSRPSPGDTPPSPSPTTAYAQSFPDAMKAAGPAKVAGTDEPIKILYGVRGVLCQ